ncbi:helix-turn-helix domain-containing protein [Leptobacterium flavescens]|uniref:Helix-turn-helix domain-containing protein n=1 Tax=Leptobacterium flavescens TaxID=472055 RepID=A0A6P0UM85_9FLAO|nr:helix-turn-helix domain-containing protein [Leptobacterium flavescens]NER12959.1 helix-turn-helix domain-containing protein [Leptobacterium flavescens]
MDTNQNNQGLYTAGNIKRINGDGKPIVVTDPNCFTLLFVKHHGQLYLNFQRMNISGYRVIALCPDEVLMIENYEMLMGFAFRGTGALIKSNTFLKVFGKPEKFFEIKTKNKEQRRFTDNFVFPERLTDKKSSNEEKVFYLFELLCLEEATEDELRAYLFVTQVHFHYKMQHRIGFYAKLLGVTSKKATELFMAINIPNPHHFIKTRILAEAKKELAFTDNHISSICYEIGFNDPAYFARFFRKNTGMSPGEFRKQWQKKILKYIIYRNNST